MTFDYLELHRCCWTVLRKVNEACREQLLNMFGGGYLEEEYQLPFVAGYIVLAATNASDVAALLPKKSEAQVTSQLLVTAAKSMADILSNSFGEQVLKSMEGLGLAISMENMEEQV